MLVKCQYITKVILLMMLFLFKNLNANLISKLLGLICNHRVDSSNCGMCCVDNGDCGWGLMIKKVQEFIKHNAKRDIWEVIASGSIVELKME